MATWSEACRLASRGLVEQFGLQFDKAALTFAQAKKVLEGGRDRAAATAEQSPFLDGITSDIAGFDVAKYHALLLDAFSTGNYDDALAYAGSLVACAAATNVDSMPPVQQQLTEIGRRQSVAMLAYIRAEIAANERNWSGAEQQLELARDKWLESAELALNSGLQVGRQMAETAQASSAQALGACRRRISHERSLYAKIDELERENRELQQRPTFSSTGEFIVTEQHAGRDIAGGDIAGRDIAHRDINTAGGDIDFSKVWAQHADEIDLPKLADELKRLRQGLEAANDGTHDAEIAAVVAAQVSASENDGPSVLRWLKNAGKWVLDNAVTIGVPVAVAAAKAALGV
jgi:hypothetical protein